MASLLKSPTLFLYSCRPQHSYGLNTHSSPPHDFFSVQQLQIPNFHVHQLSTSVFTLWSANTTICIIWWILFSLFTAIASNLLAGLICIWKSQLYFTFLIFQESFRYACSIYLPGWMTFAQSAKDHNASIPVSFIFLFSCHATFTENVVYSLLSFLVKLLPFSWFVLSQCFIHK